MEFIPEIHAGIPSESQSLRYHMNTKFCLKPI